jgi:hypothetical protein
MPVAPPCPPPSPEPVEVACDARCFVPCPPLQAVPAGPDGSASLDDLGSVLIRDVAALAMCEAAREACASCIERARAAKVIR